MISLAYPIDRLDLALFSVVILMLHHWFPQMEKNWVTGFPRSIDHFCRAGGAGNLPFPTVRGGAGRPSLVLICNCFFFYKDLAQIRKLVFEGLLKSFSPEMQSSSSARRVASFPPKPVDGESVGGWGTNRSPHSAGGRLKEQSSHDEAARSSLWEDVARSWECRSLCCPSPASSLLSGKASDSTRGLSKNKFVIENWIELKKSRWPQGTEPGSWPSSCPLQFPIATPSSVAVSLSVKKRLTFLEYYYTQKVSERFQKNKLWTLLTIVIVSPSPPPPINCTFGNPSPSSHQTDDTGNSVREPRSSVGGVNCWRLLARALHHKAKGPHTEEEE